MTATLSSQIEIDDQGVARIAGTRFKVIYLVESKMAYGWSPEEMRYQYPVLSMAQIHTALAYYYEHQAELDEQIKADHEEAMRLRKEHSGRGFTREELERRLSR